MSKKIGVILTYNCENLIQKTIDSIPKNFFDEVICSDDGSTDGTISILKKNNISTYSHPHLGYGSNLYKGMEIAFKKYDADYVYELHGDAQYDFQSVNFADDEFKKNNFDLILGNRFYKYKKALQNGMPIPIFLGNIFFSFMAGKLISLNFRDLFPGFRAYSKLFFDTIEGKKFSWDYRFSFEIIAISKLNKLKIGNVPVCCNYKGSRKTPPYIYAIKALISILITGCNYRLSALSLVYKSRINGNKKNSK
jgi:glycosyltransferase involved in cell wall biosynthesis|tara:strand:- start:5 stop:757 length:753 start_codon:yes stop_codon:yes gene_type:complete